MRHLVPTLLLAACTPVGGGSADDTDTPAVRDTAGPVDTEPFEAHETGDWPVASTPPDVGLCTVDGWCWVSPRPHGETLTAVDGSGPDDVWAVGGSGVVEHWDGASWTTTQLPGTPWLADVRVDRPGHPCVGGEAGLLVCLEDGAWVGQGVPATGDVTTISRSAEGRWWVTALRPDDAYTGDLLQQTATGWTTHEGKGGGRAYAVADADVWAGPSYLSAGPVLPGDDVEEHWDGRTWSQVLGESFVLALDGSGGTDVWLAIDDTLYERRGGALVEVALPSPEVTIRALDVVDPTTVVLVTPDEVWRRASDRWHRLVLEPGAFEDATAVYAPSADHAVIVGRGGLLVVVDEDVVTWLRGRTHRRSTALAAAPGGGVFFDHDGLQRIDGTVRRELSPPPGLSTSAPLRELRAVDGALWALGEDADPDAPADTGTEDVLRLARRGRDHAWTAGGRGEHLVGTPRRTDAIWTERLRGWGCQVRQRTLARGDLEALWPPTRPPEGCPGLFGSLVDPRRELWLVDTTVEAWVDERAPWEGFYGVTVRRYDGAWTTWEADADALTIVRHPTTGVTGALTADGRWAEFDVYAGLIRPTQLTEPHDKVDGVFDVGGELVIPVWDRTHPSHAWLVRWDGTTVRREVFPPVGGVAEVVRDVHGRLWASTWRGLLVHEPD